MGGVDPIPEQLQLKIKQLEEQINAAQEKILEKDFIMKQAEQICAKLLETVNSRKTGSTKFASKVLNKQYCSLNCSDQRLQNKN